jgi:hypothetical protein
LTRTLLCILTGLALALPLRTAACGEGDAPKAEGEKEGGQEGEKPEKPSPELLEKIRKLVEQLGDADYQKREDAGKELLKIGGPALDAVREAAKDKDPERAERARELVPKLERMLRKGDPNATNGWQAIWGDVGQVQTFKVTESFEAATVRLRLARGYNLPGTLEVKLRGAKEEKEAEPLAEASKGAEWDGKNGGRAGVSRYFRWLDFEMSAKLEKDKVYRLVLTSDASGEGSPWLANTFYRDTYPGGELLKSDGEKTERVAKLDLVLEILDKEGQVRLTTVPKGVDLSKKELFGIGRDGTDMNKPAEGAVDGLQGGFL